MKGLFVAVLVIAVVGVAIAKPAEKYTTKYDNIDLDAIISNDRLMKNYIDCLLGKGRCTADGNELKKYLPDAIQTACSKCSEKQREGSEKVIRHLAKNKKDWWKALTDKYDPEGKFKANYAKYAEEKGINI